MGETESLQVEDTEGLHHRPGAGGRVEMVAGQLGAGAAGAEGVQGVHGGLLVGGRAPGFERPFGDDHFARVEGREYGQQVFGARVGGKFEFAGRQVEPRGAQGAVFERDGTQVVVARGIELVGREGGAGAQDADQGAAHELAGPGVFELVADGDLASGLEDAGDVIVRRVKRQAGHGRILPPGQREAEQPGAGLGVLVEHLEEIAEPEKQDRARRKPAFDLEVLLHHRGLALGRHGLCI